MNNEPAVTLTKPTTLETFCTLSAHEMGEQIFGTATETSVWLVLEYPFPWGAKALPESALPAAVKEQLQQWERTIPGARIQLVKQRSMPLRTPQVETIPGQPISFFVSLAREQASITYRFSLESYLDLLNINLPDLVNETPGNSHSHQGAVHTEPLYLVCTNGKRDRCCAKWGLPVYQAMADYASERVWQTTHTGGHRFSATLVCLPQGAMYGWVESADARPLIDAHEDGQIYRLDRYRGRSCYPQAVQAADYYLRMRTDKLGLDAYQLTDTKAVVENQWQIAFQETVNGASQQVALESRRSDALFFSSCVKAPAYIDQFYEI